MKYFHDALARPMTLDLAVLRDEGPERAICEQEDVRAYRARWSNAREDLAYFRNENMLDKDERFASWVASDPEALRDFVMTKTIKCKMCDTRIAFRPGYLADLFRHASPKTRKRDSNGIVVPTLHEQRAAAARDRALRAEQAKARLQVTGVAREGADGELVTDGSLRDRARLVRQAQLMKLVADGSRLNQVRSIFTRESVRAADFHMKYTAFGTAHTAADDISAQEKLLRTMAAAQMEGKYGTIVIDGASSALGGGSSVSAIIFVSAELPGPIALNFGVAKGSGDAAYYVRIIRSFARRTASTSRRWSSA